VPADYGFRRDDDEGLLPKTDQTRRATTQKIAYRKAETRARMSTLQRDELLTQSEILEKETSPPAKEAAQHPKQSPTKRNMVRIYNRTVVRW